MAGEWGRNRETYSLTKHSHSILGGINSAFPIRCSVLVSRSGGLVAPAARWCCSCCSVVRPTRRKPAVSGVVVSS